MRNETNRREFLKTVGVAGASLAAMSSGISGAMGQAQPIARPTSRPAKQPNPRVIGIIGTGGRGTELAGSFAALSGAVVKYVCDVDASHAKGAAAAVLKKQDQ